MNQIVLNVAFHDGCHGYIFDRFRDIRGIAFGGDVGLLFGITFVPKISKDNRKIDLTTRLVNKSPFWQPFLDFLPPWTGFWRPVGVPRGSLAALGASLAASGLPFFASKEPQGKKR